MSNQSRTIDSSKWITTGIESYPRLRPCLPFIVLDQNRMRIGNDGIDYVTPLLSKARSGHASVLIPDVSLVEMTQNPTAWESTLSQSLRLITNFPDGVVLGRSISEMAREEIATGQPVSDYIDHDLTPVLRELISDLATGRGPTLDHFREKVGDARAAATRDYYRHEDNKARVLQQDSGWRDLLTPEGLKALRNGDDQLLRLLALRGVKEFGVQPLLRRGASKRTAQFLLSTPSVSLSVLVAPLVSMLMWVADGGIHSRVPKDTSNDGIDLDYVRVAVFGQGIETRDERMCRLVEHVGAVMDMQVLDALNGMPGLLVPDDECTSNF